MPPLTPTVHERLARCGTRVKVTGLISGADVALSIDGTEFAETAGGGSVTFHVPSLAPGAEVRARQDDGGSGFTPWSAPVIVEDAQVPPVSTPQLPEQVGECSQCVRIVGVVPGCEVEAREGGNTIGTGIADRHGAVCLGIKRRRQQHETHLCARMIVCGQNGPLACTPFAAEPPLGKPTIGSPIYGCQRIVPLESIHRGARTRLETQDPNGTSTKHGLGSICNCWSSVNVRVHEELKTGWQVRARQYWNSDFCKHEGDPSGWRDIIAPDEGIRPTVLPALVEGDQVIRVENQILGGDLMVLIREGETGPITEYGPRPASEELEISLNGPLSLPQFVAVRQTLCGHEETSDWVEVLPLPPVIYAPFVQEPLFECAGAVQVSGLHAGAVLRVYADGIPIGIGWAGLAASLSVTVLALSAGQRITAKQWVGGTEGPESAPVIVQAAPEPHRPRILEPVAKFDTRVWVSGVTPGCRVSVWSGAQLLVEVNATEPIVQVPVSFVPGPVHAWARLCSQSVASEAVTPIKDPGADGSLTVNETTKDYGSFMVPMHLVNTPHQSLPDGNFSHPVRGRLYFPSTMSSIPDFENEARPLVIIAHGYQLPEHEGTLKSHLGYGWLARHLASWGMFVFSIDLAEANKQTDDSALQQSSRGEIILKAIEELLDDNALRGTIDRERIALVGHSMGGEGVVVAQALNQNRPVPIGIKGVVSIAPTQYRPDIKLEKTNYLQLIGSLDLLLSSLSNVTGNATGDNPRFGSWRIYERADPPKTHVWIYRARHDGFNSNWWFSGGLSPEPSWPEELTLGQHQRIGRAMINAFLQDAFGDSRYKGYLSGPVRPQGLYQYEIFPQHHAQNPDVIDDFGDATGVLDKTENVHGPGVATDGTQVVLWEDVKHVTLAHSVHDTNSTDLEWNGPDAGYLSPVGSVAVPGSEVVSLRVALFYDEDAMGDPIPPTNPEGVPADLFVELVTAGGRATVRAGTVGDIPYPYPRSATLSVMRTVRIPLDALEAVAPGGSLTAVGAIRLWMAARPTGRVLVDDLEFA